MKSSPKKTEQSHIAYTGVALRKRTDFILKQISVYAQSKSPGQPKILEVGCGTGGVTFPIASSGHNITGVDLDPASIAACSKRNIYPNAIFKVGNAETIVFESKFDVVVASEVLEHVPHPERLVSTISRNLKDDGIGILSVPNGYCLWEIIVSRGLQRTKLITPLYRSPRFYRLLSGGNDPFYSKDAFCFHVQFFTFTRLERMLADHGFHISIAHHSDLGIFPEWEMFRPLKYIECKIADIVPHALAGGWLLVIKKKCSSHSGIQATE